MVRREVLAFNAAERFVHWLTVASFTVLLFTGLVLYLPQLSPFAMGPAGQACRLLHRAAAIAFGLVPFIYLLFDPWGLVNSVREIFTWSRSDFGWLKAAPTYYFLGDEEAMPPQSRFNTGQKLFYCTVVITIFILGVTGLVMWFDKGTAPPLLWQWTVILHDLAMIALTGMTMVHVVLATIHPVMEGGIAAMLTGWLPEEYVARHHAKWYEQIRGRVSE